MFKIERTDRNEVTLTILNIAISFESFNHKILPVISFYKV